MEELRRYKDPNIDQEELDALTRQLLRAKIARDKKQQWAEALENKHGFKKGDTPRLVVSSQNRLLRRGLSAAAAILLLVAAVMFLWKPSTPTTLELAQQYLSEEKVMGPQTRKGSVEAEALSQQAFDSYHAGNFAAAIDHWKQLEGQGVMQAEDYFFAAMSYLKNGQLSDAINYFSKIRQQTGASVKFQKEATWMMALCLIQNGDNAAAKVLLNEVIADGWRREKAEMLLKSLEANQ